MIRTSRRFPLLVTIWATLSVGCATSYSPREPGRIHVVTTAGGRLLEKDGKRYGMFGLSSDPIEAVSGNPAAEEHARTFVHRRRTGGALFLLGIATSVAAAALVADEPVDSDRRTAAVGIICASMVTALVSGLVAAFAQTHLYDAINIYNDDVSRGLTAGADLAGIPSEKQRDGCSPLTRSCLRAMAPRAP